jgi:MoxR-like ATPase
MYGGCTPSQDATPLDVPAPPAIDQSLPPRTDAIGAALSAAEGSADGVAGGRPVAGFTAESIRLLEQLPARRADPAWHAKNQAVCRDHLHRPLLALLEAVRERHVRVLSPEVAGGRRQLASLKKNGYGKGCFHDACWFGFYDPAVASKARSPQLFCRLGGGPLALEYGLSIGGSCETYLDRLRCALREAPDAVAAYMKTAPPGVTVTREAKDHCRRWTAAEWCDLLRCDAALALGSGLSVTQWSVRVSRPLSDVLDADREGRLADEVGAVLAWAWPFFEASRTGRWPAGVRGGAGEAARERVERESDVDEFAARSLDELAERTSLPPDLLRDMEDALLARHQIVLTGPPGTSKTFIARQFSRYFAREHACAGTAKGAIANGGDATRPQGVTHTLYMHAGWSYEDFFEGLRPVDRAGRLAFENRPGVFLDWVCDALRFQHPGARHLLVLDELNRCDTAAVLGELMQLLEYRGVTVPLLSGRPFVFPENLYLIGTMNSADRSVGRIDLALRRRFFWINLHPRPDVLSRWLARPGNNPAGFDAEALRAANNLLENLGVPPEQQVGHALFMGAGAPGAAEEGLAADDGVTADEPLTEKRLRQVVRFSVVPYVRELLRELMLAPAGRGADEVLARVEAELLSPLNRRKTA